MIELKEYGFTQQSLSFNSSSNEKEDFKYYLSFSKKERQTGKNSVLKEDSATSTRDKTEEQQPSRHIAAFC